MKKIILVLSLLNSMFSFSQEHRLGLSIGLASAENKENLFSFGTNDDFRPEKSYLFECSYSLPFKDSIPLFLQTGISYEKQSSISKDIKLLGGSDEVIGKVFFYSNYLRLPILLRFEHKFFYFNIGPNLRYLVESRLTNNFYESSLNSEIKNLDEGFSFTNRLSIGVLTNIGFQIGFKERYQFFSEVGYRMQDFYEKIDGNGLGSLRSIDFKIGVNYQF